MLSGGSEAFEAVLNEAINRQTSVMCADMDADAGTDTMTTAAASEWLKKYKTNKNPVLSSPVVPTQSMHTHTGAQPLPVDTGDQNGGMFSSFPFTGRKKKQTSYHPIGSEDSLRGNTHDARDIDHMDNDAGNMIRSDRVAILPRGARNGMYRDNVTSILM
jgi:hypothetical protein